MVRRFPVAVAWTLPFLLAPVLLAVASAAEATSEDVFHRGYFLQTHERDYARAATAFEQVAADEQAPAELRNRAARRMAQCREELAAEDLARLMPPDALAYVEVTRPGDHAERLLEMLGLVRDGEAPAASGTGQSIPLGNGLFLPDDFAVSPALVSEVKRLHGAAVAITEADPQREIVRGVLVLHPGEDNNLRGQIETGIQLLPRGESIEGHRVYHFEGQVWIALTARLVLVADSREQLAATINRLEDAEAESLADREDFQRSRADAQDALLFAYLSGKETLRRFGSEFRGHEAMIARSVLDLDHLESITLAAGTCQQGLQIEGKLNMAEGSRNLAYALVRTTPLNKRSLRYVPAGVAGVVLLGLNPADEPVAEVARTVVQNLTAMDLGRELFHNVEELALFALPSAGGPTHGPPIPEVAMVVAVKDAAKSEALWDQLLSLGATFGGPEFPAPREVTIEGIQGKAYAIPEGPPVVVVRVGDGAMVAGTESAVAAAIRAAESENGIESDATFKPLLENLDPTTSKALLLHVGRAVQVAAAGVPDDAPAELKMAGMALKDLKIAALTEEGSTQFAVRLNATGLPNLLEIVKQIAEAQHGLMVRAVRQQAEIAAEARDEAAAAQR